MSIDASTWQDKNQAAYNNMVRSTIKKISVTSNAQLNRIIRSCRHDENLWGYGTWRAVPEFGLEAGWRLIPRGRVSDTHRLNAIHILPGEPLELT
eukprot:2704196-Pyramimonas_sp.AAC.1